MEAMLLLSLILLVGSVIYVGFWLLLIDRKAKQWWYWTMMIYGILAAGTSYVVGCVGLYLYW